MMPDELRKKQEDAEKVGIIEKIKMLYEDHGRELADHRIIRLKKMDNKELQQIARELQIAETRHSFNSVIEKAIHESNDARREKEDN